jgi:glucose/arabinose dehydrogenase
MHRLSTLIRVALAVLIMLTVPLLWFAPIYSYSLSGVDLVVITSGLLAFTTGLLCHALLIRRSTQPPSLLVNLLLAIAAFSVWFTLVVIARTWFPSVVPADYSLPALATTLGVGIVVLLLAMRPVPATIGISLLTLFLAASIATHAAYRAGWLPRPPLPSVTTRYIDTSLYRLQVTTYSNWIPVPQHSGGGIADLGSDLLFSSGSGELFVVRSLGTAAPKSVIRLPYPVPVNVDDFVRGAAEALKHSPGKIADSRRFRVADLLTVEKGDHVTIYASHHYWDVAQHCYVMRVSTLDGSRTELVAGTVKAAWRTLFQSAPCVSINSVGPLGLPFEGWENGGRMALLNDHELLLTLGDQGFDGVNRLPDVSQDPGTSYGKSLRVPLDGSRPTIYTTGHRNAQGLWIAADGTIWSTEHGPRGGDELNRLTEGANYGWPLATIGTEYGRRKWSLDKNPGRHDGFTPPVFAFVPSIGISNLIGAPEKAFPAWAGDLLIGSLVRQTLYRVRRNQSSVQFVEAIPVGNRIRDLAVTHDGALVIWPDDGNILVIKPRDESAAEALLAGCTACHSMIGNDPSFTGPNLHGVVNRLVAALGDFAYSPAMKSFGGRWTRERLDRFLANPQSEVAGTTMQYPGIANATDRAAIIEYLENQPNDTSP